MLGSFGASPLVLLFVPGLGASEIAILGGLCCCVGGVLLAAGIVIVLVVKQLNKKDEE